MPNKLLFILLVLLISCGTLSETTGESTATSESPTSVPVPSAGPVAVELAPKSPMDASAMPVADVTSVTVSGEPGSYRFEVTISSPDTGCDQYADWWEIVDLETGNLLYRRILAHSHVEEQPFTRSGGPVPVEPDQSVVVRGHMGGLESRYGGIALGGTVDSGFQPMADTTTSLESVEPLPKGCAF